MQGAIAILIWGGVWAFIGWVFGHNVPSRHWERLRKMQVDLDDADRSIAKLSRRARRYKRRIDWLQQCLNVAKLRLQNDVIHAAGDVFRERFDVASGWAASRRKGEKPRDHLTSFERRLGDALQKLDDGVLELTPDMEAK